MIKYSLSKTAQGSAINTALCFHRTTRIKSACAAVMLHSSTFASSSMQIKGLENILPYRDPERKKENDRAYRLAHLEEKRARDREYRELRRVEIRAKQKARRLELLEEYRAKGRVRNRRWVEKHHDKRLEIMRNYRAAHADELRQRQHEKYVLNPAIFMERARKYREAHPDKVREFTKLLVEKRRARKQKVVCDLTAGQWEFIKHVFNHCCAYCGKKQERLTQDHITPIIYYGPHTAVNIVPACKSCNSKKGKGPPPIPVQPILPLGF